MSNDARNCIPGGCHKNLVSPPATIKPLVCGAPHAAIYGSSGYDNAGHWCNTTRSGLNRKYSKIDNINFGGQGDIKNFDGSVEKCKVECDQTTDCQGFIHNGSHCWLKNKNITTATPANGLTYYYAGVPPFTSVSKETPANDWGNGLTYYLDRHDLNCGEKSTLSQLQLTRPATDKIQYKYTCNNTIDAGKPIQKSTPMNDYGGGQVIFLDRHNIQCDPGQALTEMKLVRNADGRQYQYQYQCSPIPNLSTCVEKETPANELGNNTSIYLDRHNVKCGEGEVLSGLRFVRPTPGTIQYKYRCCSRKRYVTLYQHGGYGGYAVNLAPGKYTTADLLKLGVQNNDVSSIKSVGGARYQIFDGDNFQGVSLSGSTDTSMPLGYNDVLSSIIVS
jgi:hypothetical protein